MTTPDFTLPTGAFIPPGMTDRKPPPVLARNVAALFGYYKDHNKEAPAKMISVLELAEMAANPTTTKHPRIAAFAQHNGKGKTKPVADASQFAMIVEDHDHDNKTREQIEQLYDDLGVAYLAFTSSSHMLTTNKAGKTVTPSNKWKVVIPLAGAVDAVTFNWISKGIAQSLGTDEAQAQTQQIAYVPNVIAKGNPYQFINKLGDPAKWLRVADDCEFMNKARSGWQEWQEKEAKKKEIENKAPAKQRTAIAGDAAGIVEKIIDYYSGDAGAVITERGYQWKGGKYLSPFSSSGAAGVSILEDGGKQYVYSHHSSSDPLSAHNHGGHRLDLFDVLVALDHSGDFEAAIKHYAPLVDPEGQAGRQKVHMEKQAAAKVIAEFGDAELARLAASAQQHESEANSEFNLPPLPVELQALPDGLGEIQQYVYGMMTYPCLATAGWAAIATMTAFAQTKHTIDSRSGLGFNEYYLTLAKTGFGKEELRDPVNRLSRAIPEVAGGLPAIETAAPSSRQGLHQVLENVPTHSVYIQSDEFAEWLKMALKDANKQQALAYLMEIYSKALRTIHPGAAVTQKYNPVKNPRLSVFATTTAESILSTMTLAHAEMGAYNRFVIYVAPEQMPEKKYTGLIYEPSQSAIDAVKWVAALKPTNVTMSKAAIKTWIEHDKAHAEPIKFKDGLMGGRLGEQAIKLAGLFALSGKRTEISAADMELAYKIRIGLYQRAAVMIEQSGAISGSHETTKALEQVQAVMKNKGSVYISRLKTFSRAYKSLHINEQNAVVRTLIEQGDAVYHPESKKILVATK